MSTRTITALFETRSDAEHARDRLGKSGIPFTSMQLMQNTVAASDTEGFWSKLKHFFLPDAPPPRPIRAVRCSRSAAWR